MSALKVKKNDTVLVITGKDKGKKGKVERTLPSENKVIVDGVNVQYKHKKARSAQDTGGRLQQLGPIDASNVMVICPKCGEAVRVAYKIDEKKDVKFRVCKKCGESLDKKVVANKKSDKSKDSAAKEKDAAKAKIAKKQ